MPSLEKVLFGAAGVTGAAIATWRTMFPWIIDDIQTYRAVKRMTERVKDDFINERYIIDMFEEHVARQPEKPFILFEDKVYTYGFVDDMANRVANVAAKWKLDIEETVAIMIENEPSFVWILLGLQKLGLAVGFINYHLTGSPLLHSIKTSEAKLLIIGDGASLLKSFEEIQPEVGDMTIYVQGKLQSELPVGYVSFDDVMFNSEPLPICRSVREEVNFFSPMCFIYTSGTTGLPKPAIINHGKAIGILKFYTQINYNKDDVIYVVTPLYLSSACGNGLFNTIDVGATIALRRKFSLRHFLEDVRKYKVTVIQYIGELCRYLLKPPLNEKDSVHKVRVAVGNGLRPDIWKEFQERFKIPYIAEFFGATEATSSFINIVGKVGAIGRWSPLLVCGLTDSIIEFLKFLAKTAETKTRVNNFQYFLTSPMLSTRARLLFLLLVSSNKIGDGEEGLLLSAIPASHTGFYRGSEEMNEKKVVRNVQVEDDQYFDYGDLVFMDQNYFLYFRDRTGDTFRWKGENVSTREVADCLSTLKIIQDVNVYGVTVPGTEGRAGMAAIVLKGNQAIPREIIQSIYKQCHHNLPPYARPVFLRFVKDLAITQTMKQRKIELVYEGFDKEKVQDPIYFLFDKDTSLQLLTSKL